MKRLLYFLTLGTFFATTSYAQDQEIDPTEDSIKVASAVVKWADDTFYMHKEYKFDHFHAFYSEEFFIATMRSRIYKERLDLLQKKKETGRYQKSDAEYEKEHEEMKTSYDNVMKELDTMHNRVTHYEIHFWSNIQTNDGITVYYEHIIKLDNDYKVTEAVINSAIGKKSSNTKILYKKDVVSGKKKVSKDDLRGQDDKEKTVKQADGKVSIQMDKDGVKEEKSSDKKSKKNKKKKKDK